MTLFTVLQLAFFRLTICWPIPSDLRTGRLLFTTVCCAVTARFFTAAHPGFLLFGPWEMASCP